MVVGRQCGQDYWLGYGYAKVSGAKEIYEELIVAVPSRENEFRKLSLEQEKKHIKKNEKINTLIGIINQSVAIMQWVLTSIWSKWNKY